MDVNQESLKLHEELRGKIEVVARRHIETRDDLSLLYTPGVADPAGKLQRTMRSPLPSPAGAIWWR